MQARLQVPPGLSLWTDGHPPDRGEQMGITISNKTCVLLGALPHQNQNTLW